MFKYNFVMYTRLFWACVIAACIIAYALAGQIGVLWCFSAISGVSLAVNLFSSHRPYGAQNHPPDRVTRAQLTGKANQIILNARHTNRTSACLMVHFCETDGQSQNFDAQTLKTIARNIKTNLQTLVRDWDFIAQIDDGTFAIITTPTKRFDIEAAISLANRIHISLQAPLSIYGTPTHVQHAIGLSLTSQNHAAAGKEFTDMAELAMMNALKTQGTYINVFSQNMLTPLKSPNLQQIESQTIFPKTQISPWFQPQLSLATGTLSGVEALARWDHPTLGTLSPDRFLDMFQKAGHMPHLGRRMLQKSLNALRAWDTAGFDVPHVSINLSADELHEPHLFEHINWQLDRFGLEPNRLGVEILESVIAKSDTDIVVHNIKKLAKMGCRVDIDDFGVGHASISSLQRFRAHRLKIDKSFIKNIDQCAEKQRMIETILTMAHHLHLETVAEGVETKEQQTLLTQMGCDYIQGYLLGKPMPKDNMTLWLQQTAYRSHRSSKMSS